MIFPSYQHKILNLLCKNKHQNDVLNSIDSDIFCENVIILIII